MEKQKLMRTRWSALKNERTSWMTHWKDISDHVLPRAGRYFLDDRNRGDKRHNNIYDSTGTRALRILAAGLMAGMTSPARPWFRLTTSDPSLDEAPAVKQWLADTTRVMQMVFARSNVYRMLHGMYEELGAFGTAGAILLPDYKNVVHGYPVTAGEYAIAQDYQGRVNAMYREFQMTVGQMVEEFGKEAVSQTVRNAFDRGNLDHWVPVIHVIEPRKQRDMKKRDNVNMPVASCYFETAGNEDKFLRESGFQEFPVLAPRWQITAGDIYGQSPAMEALGDIKQLQHQQLRKAQGIDYQTKPPLQIPTGLKNGMLDTLPGGYSYYDAAAPSGGIRAAFEVRLDLSHLREDIEDVRSRINAAFYADLFMMLYQADKNGLTATEVAERHEEKLLMLGPVIERQHNEILDPLIEQTFARMVEANLVPPAPEELQGRQLNIEFVSMLAQAQRAVATNSIDRFVGNLGAVAQIKPEVLDKFDADAWVDAYADMLGIDPELIVPGEQVAMIRQQRAQMAQQQQQAALAEQAANTANKLAGADTSGQNALTDVTQAFSGYTT